MTVSSDPFPTPEQVEARRAIQLGPLYDRLKELINERLGERPNSDGGYSIDLPHDLPQAVVERLKAELNASGWVVTQGSSAKNEPYLEFRRPR